MTQEQANLIATGDILAFDFMPNFKAISNTSLPIHNLETEGVLDKHKWECGDGYDTRYEKPLSQGGVYPSVSDINAMFHISSSDARRNLVGGTAQWNYYVSSLIGGYGKGAMIRSAGDNKVYISRTNKNTTEIPSDGEETEKWTPLRNKPQFNAGNKSDTISPYEEVDVSDMLTQLEYPNLTYVYYTLPRTSVTAKSKWMKLCIPHDAVYCFTNILYFRNGTDSGEYGKLCVGDGCVVKLSVYDDLYENSEHASEYIVIYSKFTLSGMSEFSCNQIPLKAGSYYVYIEYTNACAEYTKAALPYIGWMRWLCPCMVSGVKGAQP